MRRALILLLILLITLLAKAAAGRDRALAGNPAPDFQVSYLFYFPIIYRAAPMPPYNMTDFLIGDGRLYEVQHSIGSQARHQTQIDGARFYHTKGDEITAEWEELWATAQTIFRGTDTSPGNDLYYTLRDNGAYGSAWSPRFWNVGDLFEREPLVTFYDKKDCSVVVSGTQRSWLLFEAFYPWYTFQSGITLANVIQLAWLDQPGAAPIERYFYAEHYGLVGWSSISNGSSYVSEIHAPGQRPDNTREPIDCLDPSGAPANLKSQDEAGPLPPPYRAK